MKTDATRRPTDRTGSTRSPSFRILLIPVLLLLLPTPGVARQGGVLEGEVREDPAGRLLAGVRVDLPSLERSAVTGTDGRFRFDGVPPGELELRATLSGYTPLSRSIRVEAGAVQQVNLALRPSPVALDALVVTAAGIQRRRELGNAATTLHVSRELERSAPTTLTSLLQGRAAGVQVLQNSGTVGTSSTVRMRGNGSLHLDVIPLIYIDGARISPDLLGGPEIGGQNTSRLNDLTLDDVESIEIIRGPSAATLYGTEAATGVILVTTKRGISGRPEWTFRSELGASRDATDWPDVVFSPRGLIDPAAADTVYRMNLLRDGRAGDGVFPTPWRTGLERSQGVSLRGGSPGMTYYLSGEYAHREGVLRNNEMVRRNLRANLNLAPSDRVDVSLSSSFGSSDLTLPQNDNTGEGFIAAGLIGFPWEMPLVRSDPVTGEEGILTCPLHYEFARLVELPLAALPGLGIPPCAETPYFAGRTFEEVGSVENRQQVERFTASATVHWRPLAFLSGALTAGYDFFSDQTGTFYPVDPALPFDDLSLGARSLNTTLHRNLTLEGTVAAGYDLAPGLRASTTVGAQFFRQRIETTGAIGRIFPSGPTTISNALRTEGSESSLEHRTLGLFVQQQVAWEDRVFLTPAVRVDDSSAFGANLGRSVYPRVMASWVTGIPERFPGTRISSLRLRGAWGQSGKQPGSLDALQLLELRRGALRGQDVAGIGFETPGNPDLRPETGTELEVGWEADLFEGRVGIDLTWYHQTTSDAIVSRRPPPSSGYVEPWTVNIGELRNRGIEVGLFARLAEGRSVRWDAELQVGTNRGRITRLDEPIIYGADGNSQRHVEGYPFGSYFHREYRIGEDGEVQVGAEPVYLGQPTPEYEGSLSSTVVLLDRLTLHAVLGFAGGHQQFNSSEEFLCGLLGGGPWGGTCPALFERGPDGEPADAARIKARASLDGAFGPWIEDAGFARLRTVSARLELPEGWVARIGAVRGSVTVAGENLALFTRYSGLDPEVNASGARHDLRLEFFTLPPARRFSGWLTITF